MKKLCLLLALVLALACVPALAAEGDATLGRSEDSNLYFNYCFTANGTLYAVNYDNVENGLYSYRLGDADLTGYSYPEPGADDISESYLPFSDGDKLYALKLTTRYGETTEFQGAQLMAMTLNDDNSVSFEALCDVDWSDLVEYYDNNTYVTYPEGLIGMNGKLITRCNDANGNGYLMFSIDLNTGKREDLTDLTDVYSFTPYKDGTLLLEQYSYEKPDTARLLVYDPTDGSTRMIAEIAVTDYSPLNGLAYDPAADTYYCVRGGEICPVDIATGEVLKGVTDMPMESYGGAAVCCVLEGGYYAFCNEGVIIRNLDPAQQPEVWLRISDNSYIDAVNTAYSRFKNAHGDIGVVLSRDYIDETRLIENMMNRDDSVDIYTMSAVTNAYDALFNRGYLMELDGSEKLATLAESMYPSLREALSYNGHLVALPVSAYAHTIGVNEKALAALGKSMDDVPDNWPEFLDFLVSLEDAIAENGKISLLYPGYTDVDSRNELFISIFDDYQRYVNRVDPAMGYNTDMLRSLLEKLEQIDFVALGCIREDEREEHEDVELEYESNNMLLQMGTGCTIGNFYSDFTPVLLGMAPGQKNPIALEATVAVVNPFTKHPDVALAFMEELADNLSDSTRYCIDPSLNEPVRGKWNEEAIAEFQRMLDELNRDLGTADAMDKQMIEDSIRDTEESLKYYDEFGWDVGPRDLEWYRSHDEDITIAKVNWLYSNDSGEAWDLISQYRDGQISVTDLLTSIDRKVQMMLLEGN